MKHLAELEAELLFLFLKLKFFNISFIWINFAILFNTLIHSLSLRFIVARKTVK